MKTYRTAEIIGIHPNTVRLYEEWKLIPPVARQKNHYRVFTDLHIAQFRLARLAFQVEGLQNGLRKKIIQMVKVSAAGNFDGAIKLTCEYRSLVRTERQNAEEAIELVHQLLSGKAPEHPGFLTRKQVSDSLKLSIDTLRNWEMNGLLPVKRKENGYRVYNGEDLRRLKIIRSLRCANYSLEAILRMLLALSDNPAANLNAALNTLGPDDEIISACDQLIVSLHAAERNALDMLAMLRDMKTRFL